jgi:hypothetical protein
MASTSNTTFFPAASSSSASNAFFATLPTTTPAPEPAPAPAPAPAQTDIPVAIEKWDATAQKVLSGQFDVMRTQMETLREMGQELERHATAKLATLREIREDIAFAELHQRTKIMEMLKSEEKNLVSALKEMEDEYNQVKSAFLLRASTRCPCCRI